MLEEGTGAAADPAACAEILAKVRPDWPEAAAKAEPAAASSESAPDPGPPRARLREWRFALLPDRN
jgi:hypothetical protein